MAMKILRHPASLGILRQHDDETIREYINRFKLELTNIVEGEEQYKNAVFMNGLKPDEKLYEELMRVNPKTIEELMQIAEKYARGEEADFNKIEVGDDDFSAGQFLATMVMRYPELVKAENLIEAFKIAGFMNGLLPGEFNRELARDPPTSMWELGQRVELHARVKELSIAKFGQCSGERDGNSSSKKRKRSNGNRNN